MVAYAKSSVAQDALVALSKVLAGHVGHSGRTLAAQRLHASAVVGRISIPALRALDLDKPMREMVADKNFRGFRSVGEQRRARHRAAGETAVQHRLTPIAARSHRSARG